MGKSVLLGQLLQRFSAVHVEQPSNDNHTTGAVVLVTCASLPPGTALADVDEIDAAFGGALGGATKYHGTILNLLRELNSRYESSTLLIDTLDLLISDRTLPALAGFLSDALEVAKVIFTCRTYEFDNYLRDAHQSAPRLADRITKVQLPRLVPDEIIAWARIYIEGTGKRPTGEEAGFLRSLQGGVTQNGPLRQVCSVPVRLALTCETFAAAQHVPDDLTVTDLYNAYWLARVRKDKGKAGTADGDAKEQAALNVASHTVTSDGHIALQVPKGRLAAEHLHGLRLLASEGIIRDLDTSWEFFHQTFAEYSYARWILTQGIEREAIERLDSGLRTHQPGLWPVVRPLLLQVTQEDDYLTLIKSYPWQGPRESIFELLPHSADKVLKASRRCSPRSVMTPTSCKLCCLLSLTPLRVTSGVAFDAALASLYSHGPALAIAATSTMALLLPRAEPSELPDLLDKALVGLTTIREQLSSETWEHLTSTLLRPLIYIRTLPTP